MALYGTRRCSGSVCVQTVLLDTQVRSWLLGNTGEAADVLHADVFHATCGLLVRWNLFHTSIRTVFIQANI